MKQRQIDARPLKDIETEWYQKLKADGFEDIEDIGLPDRPLIEYHSTKFCKASGQKKRARYEKYYDQFEAFLNSSSINDICELIVKHGNSSMGPKKVKKILQLHVGGLTERKIAAKVKCTRDCVHRTLKKAQDWMNVA